MEKFPSRFNEIIAEQLQTLVFTGFELEALDFDVKFILNVWIIRWEVSLLNVQGQWRKTSQGL